MALSKRVREFLANPPAGSKTRAALEFGVDLSLTARRLAMTPDERLENIGARMDMLKAFRRARRVK
jgi:hypothetical protein